MCPLDAINVAAGKPLRGAMRSPLVAKAWGKEASDRANLKPDFCFAPAGDFMHAHKWKRGVRENVAH